VLICSIDNMPTQLPLESTVYFGSKLLPLIPSILQVDAKKTFQKQTQIPREIRDVIQLIIIKEEFIFFEFVIF